jgi:hypothetical protein
MTSHMIRLRGTEYFMSRGEISILVKNWCTESYTAATSNHSSLEFIDRRGGKKNILVQAFNICITGRL